MTLGSAAHAACRIANSPPLAIFDVAVPQDIPAQRDLVTDALRNALVRSGCFGVQDKATMRAVFATQRDNGSDARACADASCVVEAGRILQVRYVATARIYFDHDQLLGFASITDVEKGTTVATAQTTLERRETNALIEAAKELGAQLATGGVNVPEHGPRRTWAIVAGGVAIALLVGGGAADFSFDQAYGAAKTSCASADSAGCASNKAAASGRRVLPGLLYGAGVVAVASAAFLEFGGGSAP